MTDDKKIREKLKQKTWNEIKTNDSWAIFKIMSEFVEGYEKLSKVGPCVSIFGSARTKSDNKYYKLATEIAAIRLGCVIPIFLSSPRIPAS